METGFKQVIDKEKGTPKMTTKQRAAMYSRIAIQGNALLTAYPAAQEKNPVQLCKRLLRLEREARRLTTAYNNGDLTYEQARQLIKPLAAKLSGILGKGPGVFVNYDSRGCAFKIEPEEAAGIAGLYRDMGGNGLIAPDLS